MLPVIQYNKSFVDIWNKTEFKVDMYWYNS